MALKVGPGMSENSDGLTGARGMQQNGDGAGSLRSRRSKSEKDALGGPTHLAKGTCPRPPAQTLLRAVELR